MEIQFYRLTTCIANLYNRPFCETGTDAQDSIYDLENKKRDAMRAYDNDIQGYDWISPKKILLLQNRPFRNIKGQK